MRSLLLALLLVAACTPDPAPAPSDQGADAVDEAARDAGPIDVEMDGLSISSTLNGDVAESVVTEGGEMEVGLTDQVLYSRLSKEAQAKVADEMRQSAEEQEGLGGRLARSITDAVMQGIGTAVQVPLADVRDIRVDGDRLVIEMVDGEPSPFNRAEADGKSLLSQISGSDARQLAEAFREIRDGR